MFLTSYTKKAFCWNTQSDLFPEKTFLPRLKAKRHYFLQNVLDVLMVSVVMGSCEIQLWVAWQIYDEPIVSSPPLCRRDTRLNLGSLTQGFRMTFRSWICIREISNIVGHIYSNHVHIHVRYNFTFLFPSLKVKKKEKKKWFMTLLTSSLNPKRAENLNFWISFPSDLCFRALRGIRRAHFYC